MYERGYCVREGLLCTRGVIVYERGCCLSVYERGCCLSVYERGCCLSVYERGCCLS